jgi:hypothetical protein
MACKWLIIFPIIAGLDSSFSAGKMEALREASRSGFGNGDTFDPAARSASTP